MYRMSLGYLLIDHNKAIKAHGYLIKTNKRKMSTEAAPSGQGRGNSNTEKK